jgi:hypothetical protein
MKNLKYYLVVLLSVAISSSVQAQFFKKNRNINPDTVCFNINTDNFEFIFEFSKGKKHNHPSFAIWIEDLDGSIIQPLYVTKAFGTGIYPYGSKQTGNWKPGPRRYQATLPYFIHKWSKTFDDNKLHIPGSTSPIADAYTGATPKSDFMFKTSPEKQLNEKFRVVVEFNQPWDVNEFWTNAKYPGDRDYKASCQPSLIYAVEVNPNDIMDIYYLNPIGHGHYSGKDGRLYTDLSTITTAFDIFTSISLRIK